MAVEFSHNGSFQKYLDTLMRAKDSGGDAAVICGTFRILRLPDPDKTPRLVIYMIREEG